MMKPSAGSDGSANLVRDEPTLHRGRLHILQGWSEAIAPAEQLVRFDVKTV